MKKILFCLQTMVLGGVEKELITVLKNIHEQYDITLLLLHLEDEEILTDIPDNVNVIVLNINKEYYHGGTFALAKQRLKRGKFLESISLIVNRILKIGVTGANLNIDDIPELKEVFDIAICYHIHSPLMFRYTAQKIKAVKRIGWIHNDFYSSGYPIDRLKKIVGVYDEFVAVSKKVEDEFRAICPWYQGKVSTAHNYLDVKEIELLSKETVDDNFLCEQRVKILTVGRFVEQKGIDLALKVGEMLKLNNIDFHWYIIGYGPLEDRYCQLIREYDIGDRFTILGKKNNPYPYIKACDICVQPSRHEAYPLVIMEAKILRKTIVCTDFDGADEQIVNGINGIIVPINDVNSLFNELVKLICFPEIRIGFSKELEKWCPNDALMEITKHFE